MTPVQIVARELAVHSSLEYEQIVDSIAGALGHLMERARIAIDRDPDCSATMELVLQYQAVSESILYLGAQLIAFEDMEASNDPDDEQDLKN